MTRLASMEIYVAANISDFNSGMSAVQRGMMGVGGKAMVLGSVLSSVFAPLIDLGKNILKEAATFEQAMNVYQAVSEATGREMEAVRQTAIALGADLKLPGVSATDAALAMTEMVKAGISIADSQAAARAALLLGIVGNQDFATSAEFAAQMLNAFRLEGEQFAPVVEKMAGVMLNSTVDLGELQYAMVAAASVFQMTGHTIDELIVSVGLLGQAGIEGSTAGNTLKQMLIRLIKPTDEAREIMQAYGISVYDAAGNMLPMRDIIAEFNEHLTGTIARTVTVNNLTTEQQGVLEMAQRQWQRATDKLAAYGEGLINLSPDQIEALNDQIRKAVAVSERLGQSSSTITSYFEMTAEKRNEVLGKLFGTRAINAIALLMQAGVEGWDSLAEKISKGGAASELAAARMSGLIGASEALKSAWETTSLVFGGPFLEPLTKAVLAFAEWVVSLQNLNPQLILFMGTALAVWAAAGPLYLLIGRLAIAFAYLWGPVGLIIGGLSILAGLWASNAFGIQDTLAPALDKLWGLLSAVGGRMNLGFFGQVYDAIAAGDWGQAYDLLRTRMDEIGKIAETWWAVNAQPQIDGAILWISTQFNGIIAWLQDPANRAVVVQALRDFIAGIYGETGEEGPTPALNAFNRLETSIGRFLDSLQRFKTSWENSGMSELLGAAGNLVLALGRKVLEGAALVAAAIGIGSMDQLATLFNNLSLALIVFSDWMDNNGDSIKDFTERIQRLADAINAMDVQQFVATLQIIASTLGGDFLNWIDIRPRSLPGQEPPPGNVGQPPFIPPGGGGPHGPGGGDQVTIIQIDGHEIARYVTPAVDRELGKRLVQKARVPFPGRATT